MARSTYLPIVCLLALTSALTACQAGPGPAAGPTTLRIGYSFPADVRGSGLNVLIDSLTTESLVSNGEDGRPTPRLARSWNWDADKKTLRLTLRNDVLFHDGTRLNARIVADALNRSVKDGDALSFSSVSSVEAVGDSEVQIHLSTPDTFLLEDLGNTSIQLGGQKGLGTGPFRVVSRAQPTRLQAFSKYYRGTPTVDTVTISTYPTQRSAWAAMMRGDVDMLHDVSRDALDFVEAETAVHTFSFPRPYYISLTFNVRNSALRDLQVRRAIVEGINKDVLVSDGLHGRGRVADSPIWPEYWASPRAPASSSFNPQMARLRLDKAGYQVRDRGPNQMPSRFSFECLVWHDDARLERMALLLQKQLADIGIDMRLTPVSLGEIARRFRAGNFDTALMEMASVRSLAWVYMFWHSPQGPPFINTGYASADGALDAMRRARSDEEERAATAEMAKIFLEDPPAVFIAWQSQARAVSNKFAVVAEPNRDILSTLWQWKLASPAQVASR